MTKKRNRTITLTNITGITIMAAALVTLSTTGASAAVTTPAQHHPFANTPAAVAAAHPGHAVAAPDIALDEGCNLATCFLEDAAGTQYTDPSGEANFLTPIIGHVDKNTCWPFKNCGLDAQYNTKEVLEFKDTNDNSYCMQTDSVHTHVSLEPCVAHDAGDYWVGVGNPNGRGICFPSIWLVNVGETNHDSPNIEAMYYNTAARGEFVDSGLAISDDDQWCALH